MSTHPVHSPRKEPVVTLNKIECPCGTVHAIAPSGLAKLLTCYLRGEAQTVTRGGVIMRSDCILNLLKAAR